MTWSHHSSDEYKSSASGLKTDILRGHGNTPIMNKNNRQSLDIKYCEGQSSVRSLFSWDQPEQRRMIYTFCMAVETNGVREGPSN